MGESLVEEGRPASVLPQSKWWRKVRYGRRSVPSSCIRQAR